MLYVDIIGDAWWWVKSKNTQRDIDIEHLAPRNLYHKGYIPDPSDLLQDIFATLQFRDFA
jgi:hypothetical protein